MRIDIVVLCVTCVINLILGLIVLMRSRRTTYATTFAFMTICIIGWVITNYTTNHLLTNVSLSNLCNRLAYIFGYATVLAGLAFTYKFPVQQRIKQIEKNIVFGSAIVVLILSATSLVSGTVYYEFGKPAFTNGALLWIYIAGFILNVGVISKNLLRSKGWSRLEHEQARYLFVAFTSSALLGLFLNVIAPAALSNWQSTRFGPLITVILVGVVTYTIVRHHLFDLRTLVVRSVAYGATLLLLTAFYGLVILSIAKLIFHLDLSFWSQVYFSAGTAVAGFAFSKLKPVFDRLSNRLFYQDAYDTQLLLDNLNRLMVANADVQGLLIHSATIIEETFKTEFCFFTIKQSDTTPERVIGKHANKLSGDSLQQMRLLATYVHTKVIVAEDLSLKSKALQDLMRLHDVAVLCRLTANASIPTEGMGYLVLGARRSGNPYTVKDVRTLETIINELVIATENSLRFEQIRHFNETLQDNISDATRKLRQTNEKLQNLDATKDEFITMASHQLRTPLTAVKGYLSMVLEGDAGKLNANQRKLLEQSYISSQRMVYLISDLLNLSRLSTGKFVIDQAPVNLADIVQAEIDQLTETAKSREIVLNYERPETFPELLLDETKIHQVVMNFIDNAIYYTPAGGSITVALKDTTTSIEFMVRDTGIGIKKSEQHHLFTKFFRAENAKRARPDGTGLGLFMAKKIIVAQNGAILFESTEGKGSMFGFRFNKRGHAVPASANIPAIALSKTEPLAK